MWVDLMRAANRDGEFNGTPCEQSYTAPHTREAEHRRGRIVPSCRSSRLGLHMPEGVSPRLRFLDARRCRAGADEVAVR